jgi:SAM-dependent methyltransferase
MSETYPKITGERIVTPHGGFNASWQRHLACYALTAPFLGNGTVLDLGCGTGHAQHHLEPRRSVGVDFDLGALLGQGRPTVRADMRKLPFRSAGFGGVACIHAIEHVPDPERAVAEVARAVRPGGTVVFVTPNRLTFGRPDEVIDPYHYIEFDAGQLAALCAPFFATVTSHGVYGSARYMAFSDQERRKLAAMLRADPLRLRRFIPRRGRQVLYDWTLSRARRGDDSPATAFTLEDFELRSEHLDDALDVVAVCTAPG